MASRACEDSIGALLQAKATKSLASALPVLIESTALLKELTIFLLGLQDGIIFSYRVAEDQLDLVARSYARALYYRALLG